LIRKFIQNFDTASREQPVVAILIYSFLGFLRPAIYIFLLPLYLSVFSDSEYGLYDLMVTTGVIMAILVTARLNAAMVTLYYDYHGNPAKQKKYLSTLFSFSLMVALVTGLIFSLVGESLFQIVFKSDSIHFFPYGITILGFALLSEVNECYYSYLKNEKNLKGYLFVILCQVLLMILFQFLLIIVFRQGVQGALLGMFLANVVTTLVIFLMEKNIFTFKLDKTMVRNSLAYSLALIPYLLISWALTRGGKIILERFDNLSQVGVFALLITLTNIIVLTAGAVVSGVRPFLFELFAEKKQIQSVNNYSDKVDLLTKVVVVLPLLAVPFIVLVGSNINVITSKSAYLDIRDYITFACLTIFLLVYAKLFYQQIIFAKKSSLVTQLSFVVLIVLFMCLYFWVPAYKIWGVLSAMAVANLLMTFLFYLYGRKSQPIKYNTGIIFILPAVIFGILFLIEWIMVHNLDISQPKFGMIQFLVLVPIILITNRQLLKEYKALFLQNS